MSEETCSDSEAVRPVDLLMQACSYWGAMKLVADHAGPGNRPALLLLGGSALEMAFKAVLAASGWPAGALSGLGRNLEAGYASALDCGLTPHRDRDVAEVVVMISAAWDDADARSSMAKADAIDLIESVPVIGSLIVDVGEQFSSIGEGMN